MAKLSLNVEEWVAIKRALDKVPDEERDPQWVYAREGVEELLNHVADLRDKMGDPRPITEIVCFKDGCGKPIQRGDDYTFDGSTGKFYHADCWVTR